MSLTQRSDVQPDTQTFAPSTLLVRTAGAPDRLAPRMVEAIRQLDPNRPIDHVQTLEEIRDETIAPQRLNATLIGLAVGGVASVPLSQLLNGLLFGIEPADPPTIALAALLLVAVAVGAAFVPGRRATAVDPITALRSDG